MSSLPKVTLLGDKGNTYSLGYGEKVYEFTAGIPRKVPVPVARAAERVKDKKDKKMFSVGWPQEVAPSEPLKTAEKSPKKAKQNVAADSYQQTL